MFKLGISLLPAALLTTLVSTPVRPSAAERSDSTKVFVVLLFVLTFTGILSVVTEVRQHKVFTATAVQGFQNHPPGLVSVGGR